MKQTKNFLVYKIQIKSKILNIGCLKKKPLNLYWNEKKKNTAMKCQIESSFTKGLRYEKTYPDVEICRLEDEKLVGQMASNNSLGRVF